MKKLASLAFGLGLALVATAPAQTVVNITGSSAYRGATHNAICRLYGANDSAPNTLSTGVYGYVGSSLSGAGQAIFSGTYGGNSVIVRTSWSGSVGGVQTVSEQINVNFLPLSTTGLTAAGTANLTAGTESARPDVAMSDTYQSSTPFNRTTLVEAPNSPVGVVPFVWVASADAPARMTNVTPQTAQALFGGGSLPLAVFTGNSADRDTIVYAIGRDPDSGTRLTAFAETGLGANATVIQYQPTIPAGTTTVTSHAYWPATTINGIPVAEGNGGYSSGGTLATAMRASTTSALGGFYLTYLSTGDAGTAEAAASATGNPAKRLTYNGVAYSDATLRDGSYTFWGYEHLLYRSDILAAKKVVADGIATFIRNNTATVNLDVMKVSRQTDGGLVTPTYY